MDITTLAGLLSNIGFPALICLLMGWYVKYITDKHTETIGKLIDQHQEESKDFKTAIDNNTRAIEALTAKVERLESKA